MRFYSTKYVFFAITSVSSKHSYDLLPIHERDVWLNLVFLTPCLMPIKRMVVS